MCVYNNYYFYCTTFFTTCILYTLYSPCAKKINEWILSYFLGILPYHLLRISTMLMSYVNDEQLSTECLYYNYKNYDNNDLKYMLCEQDSGLQ